MRKFIRLYQFYLKRIVKDSFTLGYSVVFPMILILLMGWIRISSGSKDISSFTYYTIVLLPFCICFELTTAAYQGQEEARKSVAERFLISPISIRTIMIAKWTAGVTILSFCHGFVYLFAQLVFKASYHGCGILIFVLSIAFTMVIYGIGLWLGLGIHNFIVVKNMVNIPIMIFAVLGGCFYPFGSTNSLIQTLIRLSPITWINRGIFLAMYDANYHLIIQMIVLLTILGVATIFIAIHKFKKEDYCNGDMFSYEK